MSDPYNSSQYSPGTGHNQYPPPPRQDYSSTPQSSYGGYQPAREDQYRYSPRSSGMQVGQYGSESGYGRERRNSGPYAASQYRDTEANSYYNPPPHSYDDRYDDRPSSRASRGSRGSRREREREQERSRDRSRDRGEKKHGGHEAEKAVGATLLGGAVGGCEYLTTHLIQYSNKSRGWP